MIFKFLQKKHPQLRGIYAVLKGTYSGEYIVFLRKTGNILQFISFPDKQILNVPEKDFKEGVESKILDYIQTLPKDVYSVVEEEANRLNKKNGLRKTDKNSKPNKRPTSRTQNYNSGARQ